MPPAFLIFGLLVWGDPGAFWGAIVCGFEGGSFCSTDLFRQIALHTQNYMLSNIEVGVD